MVNDYRFPVKPMRSAGFRGFVGERMSARSKQCVKARSAREQPKSDLNPRRGSESSTQPLAEAPLGAGAQAFDVRDVNDDDDHAAKRYDQKVAPRRAAGQDKEKHGEGRKDRRGNRSD